MRRLILLSLLLAGMTPAIASAQTSPPILGATVQICTLGAAPGDRLGVFEGAMPTSSGARTLAMRFTLQSRAGTASFAAMKVTGFGVWQRSRPNVAGLVLDKRVERLAAGTDYRVKVDFRWYARGGKVLKRATRWSPVCAEPDVRPDLRVTAIAVSATGGYDVSVLNHGAGDVDAPFGIELTVGGIAQAPPPRIVSLPAGSSTSIHVDGAACVTGMPLVATADPDAEVDEPDKSDDVLAVPCP